MDFAENSCVCGISDRRRLFESQDFNFKSCQKRSDVFRCAGCGSLFPAIFPSDNSLAEAYVTYYTTPVTRGALRRRISRTLNLTRRQYLAAGMPTDVRSVLDYGTGSGEFLAQLREAGYRAKQYGSDLFRPKGDLPFEWIPHETLGTSALRVDWIVINHVIEHLAHPKSVLRDLAGLLNHGGCLSITTPNSSSFLIRSFGRHARDIDFPRHRQIYSRAQLEALLSATGLEVQFLSPPRLNAVYNFVSCAKNVLRAEDESTPGKLRILLGGSVTLLLHLFSPRTRRDQFSPELFLIASTR